MPGKKPIQVQGWLPSNCDSVAHVSVLHKIKSNLMHERTLTTKETKVITQNQMYLSGRVTEFDEDGEGD